MMSRAIERDVRRAVWIETPMHTWVSIGLTVSVVVLIVAVQVALELIHVRLALDEVIGFIAIGILSHSLGVLGHECYHDSFLRSRRANQIVGAWLFHYPLLGRFHLLKDIHLRHHRYFGTEKDPDIDHWGWQQGDRRHLLHIVKLLFGVGFVQSAFETLKLRRPNRAANAEVVELPAKLGEDNRIDLIGILVTQALAIGLFTLVSSPWRYLFMWILPIVTVGAVVEHLRVFAEHNCGKLRIFVNPNAFEKLIFSRANFRLHALHHQAPSVPWFALGTKYTLVKARLGDELFESPSYVSELKKIRSVKSEI